MRRVLIVAGVLALLTAGTEAQQEQSRPASPAGSSATQVGGQYVKGERGERYEGGKWIEVTYGRPIKRGRENLFGSGAEYGKTLNAGSPVWRAGANATTRLKTEAPLDFGGKVVPAGEYSMFVELKNDKDWTLILSNWPAQTKYDPNDKSALWGSYGYTPEKDVARIPMQVQTLPFSMDQFTIAFVDMTREGGRLAVMWDKNMASAPFKVSGS